jgi:hypothetical protein
MMGMKSSPHQAASIAPSGHTRFTALEAQDAALFAVFRIGAHRLVRVTYDRDAGLSIVAKRLSPI